jgi:type I restriction enzyme S subunit
LKGGWHVRPLGELCNDVKQDIVDGPFGSELQRRDYVSEGIPVLKIQNVKPFAIELKKMDHVASAKYEELKRHSFRRGDIVMTKLGSPLGASAIVDDLQAGLIVADLVRIRAEGINTRYLCYHLNSQRTRDLINSMQKGTTRPRVRLSVVRGLPIATPVPEEQARIVGLLDEAFAGIAIAEANAEKSFRSAHAVFESHLQSVFAQSGEGWEETTLEKVLAVQPRNGWSPPAAHHSDSGTPVLTLSSVTGFRFRPDKIKFTSAPTDSGRRYWVENGDLLMTRSNTPQLVGHVAIASGISEPTIYPDLIMRMNPAPERIMTEFLYYQMCSPTLRKEITGRAQGANPTMKKVSNGAVRTLPIRLPSISTQRAIVATLKALGCEADCLETIHRRKLASLDELKTSLLHRAFSGQL